MPFKPKLNKVSKALGELKKQQVKMFKQKEPDSP
jgi:hypothetical protein